MEVFCYTMNKNEIANNMVKESLTDALFYLMSKKDFNNIAITELSKKAGVSRLSFYRNFDSKEDIIKKWITSITVKLSTKSRHIKSINETLVEFYIQLGFYNLVHNLVLNNYGHILLHLYNLQQFHNHLD